MSFDLGDLNPVRILAGKGSIGQSGLGSLLGTVALDAAFPGLSALETAAIVGGGTALASGSIQKGLLAGIGAYGTSDLYSGLTGAGAVSNATDVIANANAEAAAQGLDSDATAKYVQDAVSKALPNGVQVGANAATGLGSLSNAGAGLSATMNNPSALANQMGGYGSVAKNALAALSPVLAAGVNTNTPMPSTTSPTAMIRPYRYSMGRYTALNPVQADKFQGFAGGGLAHYDDGGTTATTDPLVQQAISDYNSGALSGLSAQDVVSKYGLNPAEAAAAAQGVGYTGDLSGLNYGTQSNASLPNLAANTGSISPAAMSALQQYGTNSSQFADANAQNNLAEQAKALGSLDNQSWNLNTAASNLMNAGYTANDIISQFGISNPGQQSTIKNIFNQANPQTEGASLLEGAYHVGSDTEGKAGSIPENTQYTMLSDGTMLFKAPNGQLQTYSPGNLQLGQSGTYQVGNGSQYQNIWNRRNPFTYTSKSSGGISALAQGGDVHHYDDGGTTTTDSQSPMQSTIQSWVAANPNASASDVASAVNSYIQSTGSNTKDIYNTLGQMAAQNPGQYESTLQNFNTAENIDPNTQFVSWLKQNSTPTGAGNFNTPTQSAILQEAYQLGVDPSQVNQLGLEEGIGPGSNIFQSLADNAKIASTLVGDNSNMYNLLSDTGDAETQAKFDTLAGVLGRTNRANYANADFQTLANAGIDPATYAAVTGLTPSTAIAAYNNALNPQGAGDALAAQAGLAKGTQYQLGTNGFGQQVLTYTDPKTQQQMMYTPAVSRTDPGTSNKTYNMSSVGEYASVPTTGMQSNSLFNPTYNQTYTYGQDQYTNPFNTQGQVDTTSSASLDAAYEKGLISASDYAKAKKALTQKSAGGGLMALATGGAIKHYDGSAGSAVTTGPTQAQLDAVNAAYQAGNYQQAQNLVDQYGVTSADVSKYAPTFDQSVLAKQGISLAGQDVLPAAVAANAAQSFANPNVSGTNLTQAEINQMQNAYGAKDYSSVNTMANQYGLTQADLNALYGSTAPSASTLASQGITLPGSTTKANSGIAGTNLSLPVINQMYDAWQTGDYKTAQALATQSGLTSQDLSNLFPGFNQNELALAGIQLGLKPTTTNATTNTTTNTNTQTGPGNVTTPTPGTGNVTSTILPTNSGTNAPAGTLNPYGNVNNPGDITKNASGATTVTPNVPGRPYGGYSGMTELTNAYTAGGGHTGYVSPTNVPTSNTGGSAQAYDYLMGKTNVNPVLNPITPTGQISKDYATSVMGLPEPDISTKQYIFDPATKKYTSNPDYIPTNFDPTTGKQVYGMSTNQVGAYLTSNPNLSDSDWLKWMTSNNVDPQQIADAMHVPLAQVLQHIKTAQAGVSSSSSTSSSGVASSTNDNTGSGANGGVMPNALRAANGGQMYAAGGIGHLGDYSDGGRLLKGPGDGVSDSIPATIGQGRPARLADGEFVVPARIVSELGNGSTDAGARKLYAMMDRVQAARGGTVGKGRVAKNTRADRYLPA